MTARGQMIMGGHSEALPPVTFCINISVMAMRVSRGYPYRVGPRRLFPTARLPVIGVAVIAVVSPHPYMLPAWARGTILMNADRGPKFYHDLRVCRTEAQCASDECVNEELVHFSPDYLHAGGWPMRQESLETTKAQRKHAFCQIDLLSAGGCHLDS